jgi:phosphohistidine phosphatase SixA
MNELREVDDQAASALLVGHNPTMYRLALELLVEGGDQATKGFAARRGRQALEAQEFPTCALAALYLPIDRWSDAGGGIAELRGFFTPPY